LNYIFHLWQVQKFPVELFLSEVSSNNIKKYQWSTISVFTDISQSHSFVDIGKQYSSFILFLCR